MGIRAISNSPSPLITSTQLVTPTTGQTVTITQTNAYFVHAIVAPSGTLLALNVVLPTGYVEGQQCSIITTQSITGIVMTSSTGTVLGGLTSGILNGFATYVWTFVGNYWYRKG